MSNSNMIPALKDAITVELISTTPDVGTKTVASIVAPKQENKLSDSIVHDEIWNDLANFIDIVRRATIEFDSA